MAWKCWNCGEDNFWDEDRICVMCGAGRDGTRNLEFEAKVIP
jgi:ribosomal protein L37E